MFWRTSSNDLETRYYKTRMRSQYHEHVNQKPWAISEFPLTSSDQNYIPMQKNIYIYPVFIRSSCASGEDLRGKREPGNRSFLREITLFLNLRTVRSTTNKIVKKASQRDKMSKMHQINKPMAWKTFQSFGTPPLDSPWNSIEMTRHCLDLGSATSAWLVKHLLHPIRSTTQIYNRRQNCWDIVLK